MNEKNPLFFLFFSFLSCFYAEKGVEMQKKKRPRLDKLPMGYDMVINIYIFITKREIKPSSKPSSPGDGDKVYDDQY